jgi:hypothetical protein
MPKDLQNKTIESLQKTFYFGLFTHLYIMRFRTRGKIASIDLTSVFAKWEVDAIAPSHVLGKLPPGIIELFQAYYTSSIEPLLRNELKIGRIRIGKHRRFFYELYLAGFLLGLECDMATKGQG